MCSASFMKGTTNSCNTGSMERTVKKMTIGVTYIVRHTAYFLSWIFFDSDSYPPISYRNKHLDIHTVMEIAAGFGSHMLKWDLLNTLSSNLFPIFFLAHS